VDREASFWLLAHVWRTARKTEIHGAAFVLLEGALNFEPVTSSVSSLMEWDPAESQGPRVVARSARMSWVAGHTLHPTSSRALR
jgi:hypothetical protein